MQAGKITWESGRKDAKETFFISSANPNAPVIFNQVRERTWLGSSLWQKDLLFKAGHSCISENHLAIMRKRNSFWNVTRNARSGTRNLHCNKCSYQGRNVANSVCFLRCQGLDIINEELITRSERLMFKIEKIDVDDWAGGDWK